MCHAKLITHSLPLFECVIQNLLVIPEQAEALQQTRRELSQLEEEVQEQQLALEQLVAERDACKSGAHEASDRSKVRFLCFVQEQGEGLSFFKIVHKVGPNFDVTRNDLQALGSQRKWTLVPVMATMSHVHEIMLLVVTKHAALTVLMLCHMRDMSNLNHAVLT